MIGWTTVETRDAAETLARSLIGERLAACVQVEGPLSSFYRWQGREESGSEFRLMVKFPAAKAEVLAQWLQRNHPYATPQWLTVTCSGGLPAYLAWAGESTRHE